MPAPRSSGLEGLLVEEQSRHQLGFVIICLLELRKRAILRLGKFQFQRILTQAYIRTPLQARLKLDPMIDFDAIDLPIVDQIMSVLVESGAVLVEGELESISQTPETEQKLEEAGRLVIPQLHGTVWNTYAVACSESIANEERRKK